MSLYKDLLEQKAQLEQQIAQARETEIAQAVAEIRKMIETYGLTAEDIFPQGKARASKRTGEKVAPKYKDPATGQTWTGRGKPPKWIADKDREQFAI